MTSSVGFLALTRGADSVELKLTLPMSGRSEAGAALGVDPVQGQIRQVYFFDTPDPRLNRSGVVVRARRVQRRGDDSVVKLRPVVPETLSSELRRSGTKRALEFFSKHLEADKP